ncbi:DUF6248 family natural product biosynthesis protein [Streptomyces sp. 1222.5]|uniref:DUF6248 family natural product biosynthesis protein n=1 Tax=Streptomyces sp. 1222.5 TaxID=1881026 RepID=UPI003EBB8AC0
MASTAGAPASGASATPAAPVTTTSASAPAAPRLDDYAGTITDRGGFVVAVIHHGPGQQPCRWLCPCPHPADGTDPVDTPAAPEKRTVRQRRGPSVSDDQLTFPGLDADLSEKTAADGEGQ